jgi:hypothetical protein
VISWLKNYCYSFVAYSAIIQRLPEIIGKGGEGGGSCMLLQGPSPVKKIIFKLEIVLARDLFMKFNMLNLYVQYTVSQTKNYQTTPFAAC